LCITSLENEYEVGEGWGLMIQLLLVDDEPMLLKSMVENDWAHIGVGYVFQAASGLDAAEILKKTPIDIVVTDIRMPGMNGLQLCEHIQEHYPRTKCILLSGYGEFEYARQAIKFGTVNYLLKPIKDEDLMNEVSRVKMLIQQEWEHVGSLEQARQTLHVHLALLRSNLLNNLLSGGSMTDSALAERMKEYQLPFVTGMDCSLILVRMEGAFGNPEEGDFLLFEYAVHNIACEILETDYDVWYCKDSFGYLCFLLQNKVQDGSVEKVDDKALEKSAYELQLKVAGFLKGQISVLISGLGVFPDELALHYRKSLNEFRKVPRSDREIMIISGEPRVQSRSLQTLYSPPSIGQLLEAGGGQMPVIN
jgi:two-component system response regulator YesN